MTDWMARLAAALDQPALEPGEVDALLALARDVSRRTGDRRTAPLTTFLAGQFVAGGAEPRAQAVARARDAVLAVLPEEPPDEGGGQAG